EAGVDTRLRVLDAGGAEVAAVEVGPSHTAMGLSEVEPGIVAARQYVARTGQWRTTFVDVGRGRVIRREDGLHASSFWRGGRAGGGGRAAPSREARRIGAAIQGSSEGSNSTASTGRAVPRSAVTPSAVLRVVTGSPSGPARAASPGGTS